ncbi:MAG: glycosyltransferase, partial [Acutalibacteraceae bacterium]
GESKFKSFLSDKFYKVANRLSEVEIDPGAQDFRIMKRKVVDAILSMTEYNRFTKGIFSFVGFKTKWFEHKNIERAAGETKWSLKKLFKYAIDGILGYSNAFLRLPIYLGAFFTVVGFLYGLISYILYFVVETFYLIHPITACIIFIGGLVMLSVGIVGEYIARIYSEVKGRPVFIVDETNISGER